MDAATLFLYFDVMLIASWNVNSIRSRLPHLVDWLATCRPDIVLLQETKTLDATFPFEALDEAGYNIATVEQKTYNGVAILSKHPFDAVRRGLPTLKNSPDTAAVSGDARYIEADIGGYTFASVYVPNGRSTSDPMYAVKLAFIDSLGAHALDMKMAGIPFLMGGDYNVALDDADVYDPQAYNNHILFSLPERQALRRILWAGIYDVMGTLHPTPSDADIARDSSAPQPPKRPFTWWDYRQGSWQHNKGLRIDHFLGSPPMMNLLKDAWVDTAPRGLERPSDHAPVLCRLQEHP